MERKTHWEGIYSQKSPLEVSWYQSEPELSLELIEVSGVSRKAPIIDVGGGASVLVDRLLTRGYTRVSVLDISARALALARERLGNQAALVRWYEEDVTNFIPPESYALWHDRAVFHFLTEPADRAQYLQALSSGLADGGSLILAAFALDGPRKCSGLEIVRYDEEKLGRELGPTFELVETRREIHLTPTNFEQAFQYYRYLKRGD